MTPDLSIIVPARNEEWLKHTVEDICAHKRGNTEVLVILDGAWPVAGGELAQHPDVHIVYLPTSVGQRAATNLGARISDATYIMKADAHCSFAEGFDVTLLESAKELGSNVTQVPALKNLHVYDQVCQNCGRVTDQAPKLAACTACGCTDLTHVPVWEPRARPITTNWVIDGHLHFQYASNKGQEGDYPEVMSFLGAFFFVERDHFLSLGGFDESIGSWGQYGQEWACKEWLSGGRVVCNRKTWIAHFFRVGGIGFPYQIKHGEQEQARERSRTYWRANAWPQQVRPLRWLVEKFQPAGWTEEQINALPRQLNGRTSGPDDGETCRTAVPVRIRATSSAGIVYYSDGRLDSGIARAVLGCLDSVGLPIVSVTLAPVDWPAVRRIVLDAERGYLTMFRQILAGLEALDTHVAFLAEHDVLYAPEHFQFRPERSDRYYYNQHVWKVDAKTGRALHYRCSQTSGLCANRNLLIEHYRKRIALVEARGFSRRMGFEPGTHTRPERVDDITAETWMSTVPNIDIRHSNNLTPSRWRKEQFRNQAYCEGWTEADSVPGWGLTAGRFRAFLEELTRVQQAVA